MRGIEQFLQVDAATLGALKYAGTWNASTNTPTLASGVGVQGQYYVVSVAGSTNLDGETAWQVGDWAVFNGSVWQKVDGGSTGLLTTLTVTGNTYLATTSGDVGVGTTSPGQKLDVAGSFRTYQSVAAGYNTSIFENTNATGYVQQYLNVGANGASGQATVSYAPGIFFAIGPTANDTTTPIVFRNNNATERMRITSAGDVGIGTTTIGNRVTIGDPGTGLGFTNAASGNFNIGLLAGTGSADAYVYQRANNPLIFGTNNAERMRITSAGDVGIGTSSPGQKLSLFASSANVGMRMSSSGGTGRDFDLISNTSGNLVIKSDLQSNILTVDGIFGNLGLGVTPASNWAVAFKAFQMPNGTALYAHTSVAATYLGANHYNDGDYKYALTGPATQYYQYNGEHVWRTAPSGTAGNTISFTQAMTLDASGNLGVGTSSPAARLDVSGTSRQVFYVSGADTEYRSINAAGSAFAKQTYNASSFDWGLSNGFGKMLLDSAGNLGLGVTPSAWDSTLKSVLQTGSAGAFLTGQGNSEGVYLGSNAYYNSGWKYVVNGYATHVRQQSGTFAWFTAASGTAGNAISFTQAMTLDASGNLLVGGTSAVLSAANRGNITITGSASSIVSVGTSASAYTYLYHDASGAEIWNNQNTYLRFGTNNTERARIPAAGGMVVGAAAIATNATDGFLYVPTCAGTPTGTPTTQTGTAPIVIDTTNNKLYFYSGGQWRDAGP